MLWYMVFLAMFAVSTLQGHSDQDIYYAAKAVQG